MTELDLNKIQKAQDEEEKQRNIEASYLALEDLAEKRRLTIKDVSEISDIGILELEIREQADENLFVVIDGLYNLETGAGFGGIREENIERANRIKVLADTYKIPIICTGELRKPAGKKEDEEPDIHDLMETGKFAYNANMVWLLYPSEKDREKYDKEPESVLVLKYEKNKLAYFMGKQELRFKKTTGIITETEGEYKKGWK